MEIKKSANADLERKWWLRFLIGLVVSLLLFIVALEYPFSLDDPLEDFETMDEITVEEELAPLMRQENEISLAPKAEPEPSQKLTVVDEEESKEEMIERQPEQTIEGDLADELPEPETNDKKGEDVLSFRVVEDLPQPPGGYLEFMKWLTRNLRYPVAAEERKLQGKVVAEFIVNKDGSVTDINIIQSLNSFCDREALRVLRMMPRWTPGIQNDQPCRTKVCIPIVFKL
ncbi:TonB family protein [Prevotella sp. E9-3]|uniref:energy transducer TonB n=1 Tax=Prevotella sp. E9-3 TaxID=2913621 RepID=UPI001EDBA32A|nr:energy transducer TonB [Prevotella sp. E9-3]UKK48886.1 TonB family protein [Prevotella sp. E9-3]